MKFKKEYENLNDVPLFDGEDGQKMLYDVYDGDRLCGEFKVLALGVAQILSTCELWKWDYKTYTIRRKSDGAVVWSGLDHDSA